MTYLYLIHCEDSGFYKIGIADDPISRLNMLQLGCPFKLVLISVCGFSSRTAAKRAEMEVHGNLAKHMVHTEWFSLTGKMVEQIKRDMLENE